MSESLNSNLSAIGELDRQFRIPVETKAETASRIFTESSFRLEPEDFPNANIGFEGVKKADGSICWNQFFTSQDEAVFLSPDVPEEVVLFNQIIGDLNESDPTINYLANKARWWDQSYKSCGEIVAAGVTDRIELSDGVQSLNLFNCLNSPLSESEKSDFARVMQAVVALTNGKAMSRIQGIVILPREQFAEDAVGGFSATGIMSVNLELLREHNEFINESDKNTATRYSRFFDSEPSFLEITMAHELGHAMDVRSRSEASNLGIDPALAEMGLGNGILGVSAFQSGLGWDINHTERGEYKSEHSWRLDSTQALELNEFPMTGYANDQPCEDFAETFAIMALGGLMDSAPARRSRVMQTIATVDGAEMQSEITTKCFDASNDTGIKAVIKPEYAAQAYIRHT